MKKTMLILSILIVSTAVFAESESTAAPAKEKPANPVVKLLTNKGLIVIELNAEKAPITVENFLKYTKEGFFDGTIFHRVMKGFMIQGGGMTEELKKKKTKDPIKNESYNKLRNKRGTIAMARTNAPDSATCQFFINHVDNKNLDFDGPMAPGYAVFGKVIKGMEVVDKIANIPTKRVGPHGNVPVEPVVIESVTLAETKDADGGEKTSDNKEAKCCGKDGKCCKNQK